MYVRIQQTKQKTTKIHMVRAHVRARAIKSAMERARIYLHLSRTRIRTRMSCELFCACLAWRLNLQLKVKDRSSTRSKSFG